LVAAGSIATSPMRQVHGLSINQRWQVRAVLSQIRLGARRLNRPLELPEQLTLLILKLLLGQDTEVAELTELTELIDHCLLAGLVGDRR
jgi:hypothetical protein